MTSAQPPPEITRDRWRKRTATVLEAVALVAEAATVYSLIDGATTFTVVAKVVALCGRTAAKLVKGPDRSS